MTGWPISRALRRIKPEAAVHDSILNRKSFTNPLNSWHVAEMSEGRRYDVARYVSDLGAGSPTPAAFLQ